MKAKYWMVFIVLVTVCYGIALGSVSRNPLYFLSGSIVAGVGLVIVYRRQSYSLSKWCVAAILGSANEAIIEFGMCSPTIVGMLVGAAVGLAITVILPRIVRWGVAFSTIAFFLLMGFFLNHPLNMPELVPVACMVLLFSGMLFSDLHPPTPDDPTKRVDESRWDR